MKKQILCLGFYGHQNEGDELFKLAFEELFPDYTFTFTDHLTLELFEGKDALFIGGGSFLNQDLETDFRIMDLLNIVKTIPILYIGVGLETELGKNHSFLLRSAKLVAYRSNYSNNHNILEDKLLKIPDLVHSLPIHKSERYDKKVLILPNVSVLPNHSSPSWLTASWENFKNQFAQFLDILVESKYSLKFHAMSWNDIDNDKFPAYQIVSMMKNRDNDYLENDHQADGFRYSNISSYSHVITQRYHGIVLAEMTNTPYISIYHHEKLNVPGALNYYEVSKHRLIDSFNSLKEPNVYIDFNAFDELKKRVNVILSSNE